MQRLITYYQLVLWCWLARGRTLEITLSPRDLSWRLNSPGGSWLLASLNTEDSATVADLVSLLQNGQGVCVDYLLAELSRDQVDFLLTHLLDYPNLHPFIFPFHMFFYNHVFNDALSPVIEKYRPGSTMSYDQLRFRHRVPVATDSQIKKLKGIPRPEDLEMVLELTAEVFERRRDQLGPLLATVASLHDAAVWYETRRLFPRWRNDIKDQFSTSTRDAFLNFEHQESWLDSYLYLKEAILKELTAEPVRNTLWQGKLLLCILSHESTRLRDKYRVLEAFLTQHSSEDIDPLFYESLWAVMRRHRLFLDMTNFAHLQSIMRRLDRNFPLVQPCSGGLRDHITRWYERMRLVEKVLPLEIPCGTVDACSLEQLMKWWDGQDGYHSGVLFDAGTFRPLMIYATPEEKVRSRVLVCTSWIQLLTVITSYLEIALEMTLLRGDSVFTWAPATARVIACNLLYRVETSFASFPEWPEWLYKSSTCREPSGGPRALIIRILRQLGMNGIPEFLLRPRAAPTTIIRASPHRRHLLPRIQVRSVAKPLLGVSSRLLIQTGKREVVSLAFIIVMLLGLLVHLRG